MAVAFPAESADDRRTLPFGAAADARTNGRPVVFTPAPNAVVIVAGCWNCPTIDDRTFRWVSTDNGTSFTPPVQIGMGLETQGAGTWLDDVGIFVGASFSRVKASFLATPGIGVEYASGGLFAYGPEVTRVPASNKLVAVTNDLDVVKYGVYTGSSLTVANINNAANWLSDRTFVSAEADNSETAVNSGPNGVYVSYQYFVPNDTRVGLRRFDPATDSFGAPVYVEGDDPIDNDGLDYSDSFQDPSGRLHVVWRSLYGGGRLRYRVSDPSGAAFSVAANLATRESFFGTDVAAGADGKGFAVWTTNTSDGNVRVVPLDPQAEPVTTPPGGGGGGGGTPPPGSGGGGGGSAGLPVTFTGPGNSLTAKIVGNRVRVRARGTIRLPAGAPRSACSGKVKLTVKRKRTTLATRSAKLKRTNGKCRFGKTINIRRSKVGRSTTSLRLKVSFRGNATLKAGSTTKTLVIKR